MDIHKPKPWHGLREFLKEFGTIVLGVLVALGAEQAVEWLHREHQMQEARDALRAEIAEDMMWAQVSQRRQTCNLSRLTRYYAWADGGARPKVDPADYRLLELKSTSWDTVKAGPVAAMPLKEKLAYGEFYGLLSDYNSMAERERTASIRLGEHYGLGALSAEQADSLRKSTTAFRAIETVMAGLSDNLVKQGMRTGARAASAPRSIAAEFDAFCQQAGMKPSDLPKFVYVPAS